MALLTRYVNTGSTSGGDGTTNNTTGATRAYVSLSVAEAAEQADLVTAGDSIEILCSGTAADTTVCYFLGWTTGTSNTITVKPHADDVNTSGIYDATLYRLTPSTAWSLCIRDAVGNLTIDGIQVAPTGSNSTSLYSRPPSGSTYSVINCILKGIGASGQVGINFSGSGSDFYIVNNVAYDQALYGIRKDGYMSTGKVIVYNNTVDSCGTGLYLDSGLGTTSRIYNNLLTNNTTDYGAISTPTSTDNNVTSDATGPDSGHTSKTITYTDASGEDFSTSDSDVVDLGTDLSADSDYAVTDDIIGETRSSTPTIGAFEYVSGGSSFQPSWAMNTNQLIGGL